MKERRRDVELYRLCKQRHPCCVLRHLSRVPFRSFSCDNLTQACKHKYYFFGSLKKNQKNLKNIRTGGSGREGNVRIQLFVFLAQIFFFELRKLRCIFRSAQHCCDCISCLKAFLKAPFLVSLGETSRPWQGGLAARKLRGLLACMSSFENGKYLSFLQWEEELLYVDSLTRVSSLYAFFDFRHSQALWGLFAADEY